MRVYAAFLVSLRVFFFASHFLLSSIHLFFCLLVAISRIGALIGRQDVRCFFFFSVGGMRFLVAVRDGVGQECTRSVYVCVGG